MLHVKQKTMAYIIQVFWQEILCYFITEVPKKQVVKQIFWNRRLVQSIIGNVLRIVFTLESTVYQLTMFQ